MDEGGFGFDLIRRVVRAATGPASEQHLAGVGLRIMTVIAFG
jgi:hypothetical protein